MTKGYSFLSLILTLILTVPVGCSNPVTCELVVRPALKVEVRDEQGLGLAIGTTVIAVNGTVRDSVTVSQLDANDAFVEIGARSGSYVVTVKKPGYVSWQSDVINVPGGNCGPNNTVAVLAKLQKTS